MFTARTVTATVSRAGVRTYAAAATKAAPASTKPPVALFGVDGTYASALYTASAKTQSLESTDKALKSLKVTLTKDPKLARILGSPTLSVSDKRTIIGEVMKAVGQDKTVKNFLELLAENNRLGLVGGVIEKFDTLMGAHRGEVEATITSATQLDQKTLNRLQTAISKSEHVGQGKTLKVINKVNPEVLGGLVVEVGDRTIDLSISARMAKLNKLLTDAL
ncbi:ATP synthase delta subunit-domain-containing protein [Geopyxis carbonaria]|nr:ATP synthase delta subunit-domain-containing protein [Geopyxis carbonaria]